VSGQNDVSRARAGTQLDHGFRDLHFREIDELHPMVLGNGLPSPPERRAFATDEAFLQLDAVLEAMPPLRRADRG